MNEAQFLIEIQKFSMTKLWNNPEDEIWDTV